MRVSFCLQIMNMCDKKVHVFLHIQSGGGVRFTDEERRVLETVQVCYL